MQATRQYAVEHKDWGTTAEALQNKPLPDPKSGEESLVCTRCHAVALQADGKIVIEAVYEVPPPIVTAAPPPLH